MVVSGETGAGKTLLLGALRLLCGETARPDLIGPGGDETTVEARFFRGDDEVTVTRQVLRGGRSRAYLDGSPVPARVLAERIGTMVEIVGQHDHQALSKPVEVRALVDRLLDDAGLQAQDEYRTTWQRAQSLSKESEALGGGTEAVQREAALARFQAAEIAAAGFVAGDDAELERTLSRLRHLEELTERLAAAHAAATAAGDTIGEGCCGDETGRRARRVARAAGKAGRGIPSGDGRSHRRVARRRRRPSKAIRGNWPSWRSRWLCSTRCGASTEPPSRKSSPSGEEATARADEVERLLTRAEQVEAELAEASRDLDHWLAAP